MSVLGSQVFGQASLESCGLQGSVSPGQVCKVFALKKIIFCCQIKCLKFEEMTAGSMFS